ncbi:hypothetical protein TNIN_183211 [Trichonephila inaurata madagascariensis]|uniref:Uncharacterized protein n=1 Tax=Trichonephila inaurata madagascariensis TaxID=2747483 RepID=A0A8X6MCT3_9ARAC|nr:hypothetical protein TNIN_183211 [Trichonephila inaurata madagascariensis]
MGAENPSGSSLILWSDTRRNRDRERRRNKTRIPKSRQSEAALSSAHHWRKREFRLCNTRPSKKLTPEQIKRKKTDTHTHTGIRIRERGMRERGGQDGEGRQFGIYALYWRVTLKCVAIVLGGSERFSVRRKGPWLRFIIALSPYEPVARFNLVARAKRGAAKKFVVRRLSPIDCCRADGG